MEQAVRYRQFDLNYSSTTLRLQNYVIEMIQKAALTLNDLVARLRLTHADSAIFWERCSLFLPMLKGSNIAYKNKPCDTKITWL